MTEANTLSVKYICAAFSHNLRRVEKCKRQKCELSTYQKRYKFWLNGAKTTTSRHSPQESSQPEWHTKSEAKKKSGEQKLYINYRWSCVNHKKKTKKFVWVYGTTFNATYTLHTDAKRNWMEEKKNEKPKIHGFKKKMMRAAKRRTLIYIWEIIQMSLAFILRAQGGWHYLHKTVRVSYLVFVCVCVWMFSAEYSILHKSILLMHLQMLVRLPPRIQCCNSSIHFNSSAHIFLFLPFIIRKR